MPHIQANDIQIYYEIFGEGHPLILLPGFAQNHTCWKGCIPALSKHFQVIALDNRGSGQTDAPEESYSIELFARDTRGLMEALDIPSAHLMGVSMGSLIAQQICLLFPEQVEKMVLCAPFSKLPPITKHNVKMQLELLSLGVPKQKLMEVNLSWLMSNQFMSDPKNIEQFLHESVADPYPMTMEGLLGQEDALLQADLEDKIHLIPHHTLLLVGGEDIDTPPALAKYMHKQIPTCEMHIFDKMGHMMPYEIPDAVSKRALAFLNQERH